MAQFSCIAFLYLHHVPTCIGHAGIFDVADVKKMPFLLLCTNLESGGAIHNCHFSRLANTETHLVWLEFWQHVTGCTNPQGASQHIHNAMDVMQRKYMQNAVISVPAPCCDHGRDLGSLYKRKAQYYSTPTQL